MGIRIAIGPVLFAMTSVISAGCGQAKKEEVPIIQNTLPVQAKAGFGTQCPYGSQIDPLPASLNMVDCALPLKVADLSRPPGPLILQGDCDKKVLSVRSQEHGTIDSSWEVLPDNTFDFTIDAGFAVMAQDGFGHANCLLPLSANVYGAMLCAGDRDRINLDIQVNWHVGKFDPNTGKTSAVEPKPGELFCQVPTTCYLNAGMKIRQCP